VPTIIQHVEEDNLPNALSENPNNAKKAAKTFPPITIVASVPLGDTKRTMPSAANAKPANASSTGISIFYF
jgi:hypothetical protein